MQFEEFPEQAQHAIEIFRDGVNKIIHPNLDNILFIYNGFFENSIMNVIVFDTNKFIIYPWAINAKGIDVDRLDLLDFSRRLMHFSLFSINNNLLYEDCCKFIMNKNFFIKIPKEKQRIYCENKHCFIANTANVIYAEK